MKNIFGIKDNKLGFEHIFAAPNNHAAIRMFGDACKDENSMFNKHPEDYELFHLGEMSTETGDISAKVTFLEKATTFVNK